MPQKFAIIETGGKQYLVKPGTTITIEKIPGEAGSEVVFDRVLLVAAEDGGESAVGAPFVHGARVVGTLTEQGRSAKVSVVKYKRKVRYRRRVGHRQPFTGVRIQNIAVSP